MSCLNNRMLNSGYSFLIFQVLKQMFVSMCSLFRVKAVFCLLLHPPFEMGYISIWKINMDIFSIYWIALLIFVFRLCISLISLFHLPNFSKPYTPTFEHVNSIEVGPQHFLKDKYIYTIYICHNYIILLASNSPGILHSISFLALCHKLFFAINISESS